MGADQGLTRLFYDGDCGLCNGAVQFVARRDRSGGIRFAPLGGSTFARLLSEPARKDLPDSLVVLTSEGRLLTGSEAVIHLLKRMGPPWRQLGTGLAWIPVRMREGAYRLVAHLRPARRACSMGKLKRDERFEP